MLGLASKQSTVTHPKPVFLFTVVTSGGGCGGGGGVGGEGDDGPLRGVVLEAALLLLSCPAAEVPRSPHQLVVQRTHQRKLFLPTQTLVMYYLVQQTFISLKPYSTLKSSVSMDQTITPPSFFSQAKSALSLMLRSLS